MSMNHVRRMRWTVGCFLVVFAVAAISATMATGADAAEGGSPQQEPIFEGKTLEQWKRISLADLSGEAREKSMDALGRFGRAGQRDEAIAAIKTALEQNKNYLVLRAGYDNLLRFGAVALPVVLDALNSEKASTRQIVVEVLGSGLYADDLNKSPALEEIVAALIRATEDEDIPVRAIACHSLGALARRNEAKGLADRIVPALVKVLGQKQVVDYTFNKVGVHSSPRREACEALEQCGPQAQAAVAALLDLVQERPQTNAWSLASDQELAIRALMQIDPSAPSVVAAMERLHDDRKVLHDPDQKISRLSMVAEQALQEPSRRQQEAARTILTYGGEVTFEDGSHGRIEFMVRAYTDRKITAVGISEEEKMVGAPESLSIADCLAQLTSLPHLRTLIVASRDVNDSMLKDLAPLKQLQELTLGNAPISDAGLEHLKALTSLQTLTLRKTAVTAEGVKKLQKSLPKCAVRME